MLIYLISVYIVGVFLTGLIYRKSLRNSDKHPSFKYLDKSLLNNIAAILTLLWPVTLTMVSFKCLLWKPVHYLITHNTKYMKTSDVSTYMEQPWPKPPAQPTSTGSVNNPQDKGSWT